jgi:hypothetical protein
VGAILALLLCHTELSVIALIGIIPLIGIVKKPSMIDLHWKQSGRKTPVEASEVCLLRFRPIMMTTMAALLAVTLALGTGTGWNCASPGDHDCRWSDDEPTPHALYHSSRISLSDRLRLWFERLASRGELAEGRRVKA